MTKFNLFARMQPKNKRIISLFALTIAIVLLNTPVLARQNSQSQPKNSTTSPTTSKPQKSIWQAIWELFKQRPEPSLASRQAKAICLIAPGLLEPPNTIWSDRPMFIWQGQVSQLTIYLYDSFDPDREQQLLWSQTFTPQSSVSKFHHLAYTGEALQPGQSYDLEIVIPNPNPEKSPFYYRQRHTFQVMASRERDRIKTELLALENQLATTGVSEEEIALEKANFFAKQGLWSDALQQIYSTPNPSDNFISNAREILTYLCQSN